MMRIYFFVLLCMCMYIGGHTQATDCTPTVPDLVGPEVIERPTFETGDPDYAAFLAVSQVVECHGVITEWNFYYGGMNATSACHNLRLQVWRPVTGQTYQLVGENYWDFQTETGCADVLEPDPDVYILNVPEALRIPVQQGDVIGWVDEGFFDESRLVVYDEDLSGSSQYGVVRALRTGAGCTTSSVGSTCNWAEQGLGGDAVHLVRDYSLQAKLYETKVPLIVNLPLPAGSVNLLEHQPAGQFVFTVIGHNRWTGPVTIPPPLIYAINDGFGKFVLDPNSGVVNTIDELDYETQNAYTLQVTVTDGSKTSGPVDLAISVQDVNEPHTISGLPARLVLDAAQTGNNKLLLTAEYTDPDTEPPPTTWPVKTYFFFASDPTMQSLFKMEDNPRNAPNDRIIDGELRTTRSLAAWLGNNRVLLSVYCTDGTFTAGPSVVEVLITNQRQLPIFFNMPATVTIPEDTQDNVLVYDVNGGSPNRAGRLDYIIREQYPLAPVAEQQFQINLVDGVVRTKDPIPAPFDFFTCNKYEVEVYGDDGFYFTDHSNVTVEITWVNQPPVWQQTVYTSTILEKAPISTILPGLVLDSSDRDVPVGDWTTYALDDDAGSTGAHLFLASNVTHRVMVSGDVTVPDNNDFRTIDIIVLVRDAATLEDTATLKVTVVDINDNPPIFSPKFYSGQVDETHVGGQVILKVTCTDRDGPKNSALTFVVLEPEAFIYFEVDKGSQNLILKQPISYVDFPNITFTVLAMDSGTPMLNDTATVFIEVNDKNMNRPEFEQDGFYNTEVRSDAAVGSSVVTITAVDLDLPSTSPVTYFLLKPDEDFAVKESGDIVPRKGLKQGRLHVLYIYARDQGQPERFSDPCIVRLDTYGAEGHLVDIHLQYPLEEFKQHQEDFMKRLNNQLEPWIVKLESVRLDGSPERSIARIYALQNDDAQTIDDIQVIKKFVSKTSLLKAMRTGIPGTPQDWLRGPEFSEFQPVSVVPAYPVWLVDTVGGIIFLTFLLLAIVLGSVALGVYLAKKYQWCCFKSRVTAKVYPQSNPVPPNEFELGYQNSMYNKEAGAYLRPDTSKTQMQQHYARSVKPSDPTIKHPMMERPPSYPRDAATIWE